MEKTKILFISRAYPPVVGGIENQNYELGKWLGEIAEIKIIFLLQISNFKYLRVSNILYKRTTM